MGFLEKLLPLSVITAVILFITKEVIEWHRRKKTKLAKKAAYAHALGREIRNNREILDQIFRSIEFIKGHEDCKTIRLQFSRLANGSEFCQLETEGDSLDGPFRDSFEGPFPHFQTTWYEKLLVDLAEQDGALSKLVTDTYDGIYFLEEKRNLLASLMAGELSKFLRLCAVSNIDLLLPERSRIDRDLCATYKALTNKEITSP